MIGATGIPLGRFKGRALFAPNEEEGALYYREEGELQIPNHIFRSYRNYIYKFKSGKKVEVYFDEKPPRFFYHIKWEEGGDFTTGKCTSHKCSQDIYQPSYQILSEDLFFITYEVSSPKKSYKIQTRFSVEKLS